MLNPSTSIPASADPRYRSGHDSWVCSRIRFMQIRSWSWSLGGPNSTLFWASSPRERWNSKSSRRRNDDSIGEKASEDNAQNSERLVGSLRGYNGTDMITRKTRRDRSRVDGDTRRGQDQSTRRQVKGDADAGR